MLAPIIDDLRQDILTIIYLSIGNAMAFAGIAAAKDRADLIAYLGTKK